MNQSLIVVDHTQYGLEEKQAKLVEAVFVPMIEKMTELETSYNEIVALPIEPTTIALARELRLKYVKARTGAEKIHKEAKAFYLAGGRFVDGWKNALTFAAGTKEEKLEAIEKHFENIEKQRRAELKQKRTEILRDVCDTPELHPVENMTAAQFNEFFNGMKLAKEQREEAARVAELARLAEIEEQKKIRAENERLRIERAEIESKAAEERANAEKARLAAERAAKAERDAIEKKANDARLAAERARIDAENKAKAERDAILRASAEEKAKQDKALAEERAKAEAIRKEAERKAAEERERAQKEIEELKKQIICPKCGHSFKHEKHVDEVAEEW